MKKSFLKVGFREVTNTVDLSTGEVVNVNVKEHKYIANSREEFLLVYTKLLSIFQEKEMTLPEIRLYSYLLQTWNYDVSYEVGVPLYNDLSEKFDISWKTIRNAFYKLSARGLIYSPKSKLYMLNPRYAFKGSTLSRNKSLKILLELCENC